MALEAGSVYATLGGRFNPAGFLAFDRAMTTSRGHMSALEAAVLRSTTRAGAGVRAFGTVAGFGAAGGVAALGVAIAGAVKQAGSFDQAMRNVNSIAKLSAPAFQELSKRVLGLAGKTAQAPETLAKGLYDLVSSGFDASESVKILEASARAATAGLTDTATSTRAVAAVLNAYKLNASDAGLVSDQLFQIVNRGVLTFEELANNIGDVLPFAAPLGVGLDEVGAAIATITKNGVNAAESTTQLKGIFNQLLSPSDQLQAAIHKTGFASGEALLKAKGLQGALKLLEGTTNGSKQALNEMFQDVRATSGVLNLTGKNARTAEADLKAMAHVAGTTMAAFREQAKGAGFAWQQFTTNLKVAGVTLGSELLPSLADASRDFNRFLEDAKDSGDLKLAGESLGAGLKVTFAVIKGISGAWSAFVEQVGNGADMLLSIFTTIGRGVGTVINFFNRLPGPDIDTSGLDHALDKVDHLRERIRSNLPSRQKLRVEVEVEGDKRVVSLRKLMDELPPEVRFRIKGDDGDAFRKFKRVTAQLVAIEGTRAVARIIGDSKNAEDAARRVKAELSSIPREVRTSIITLRKTIYEAEQRGHIPSLSQTPPRAGASGFKTEGPQVAIVGEGDGPEYVIPTEPRFRGRAIDLLMQAARDLGVAGYRRGRRIPPRIAFGGVPFEDVKQHRDTAKSNVDQAEGDLRQAKGAKEKAAAKAKLDRLRKTLATAEANYKAAKKTHDRERELETQIDELRDKMTIADRKDDVRGFNTARNRRAKRLGSLIGLLKRAMRLAGPRSEYGRQLRARISSLGADADATAAEQISLEPGAEIPEGLASLAEKGELERLEEAVALAGLTPGPEDDTAAAQALVAFRERVLGELFAAKAQPTSITAAADALRSARDTLTGLTTTGTGTGAGPDVSADLQAQLEQQKQRAANAERLAGISEAALSVFKGAGDIGYGGDTYNVYTVPLDPTLQQQYAEQVASGFGYQGSRSSPREYSGV